MTNLHIYGHEKFKVELGKRSVALQSLYPQGERLARLSAWKAFMEDRISLDVKNDHAKVVAEYYYVEFMANSVDTGIVLDISPDKFSRAFLDELHVINQKVTHKGVQVVFYVFLALATFGLLKLVLG
ncbi:hypothetical protein [Pseudomonas oryzihabitans]|uniref:hypothetical protein n=1 Tax=Pseudomonas oryzihabitans TaxID=47885 RepID=UPI0011A8B4D3|nr:hypothetical protein [Pseudomonas oryzihabitans]